MAVATIAMITTTTRISMRVKPLEVSGRRARGLLLVGIPVTDVGVGPFAARLVVRTERVEVVFAAMSARVHIHVVVAPRVLADALDVAARLPVTDGRVRWLRREGAETEVRGRVAGVVE